ncbi:Polyketide synthase, partial [Colletotrichum asianum]
METIVSACPWTMNVGGKDALMFLMGSTSSQLWDGTIVFMTFPLAICVMANACRGSSKFGGPGACPSRETPPRIGTGSSSNTLFRNSSVSPEGSLAATCSSF